VSVLCAQSEKVYLCVSMHVCQNCAFEYVCVRERKRDREREKEREREREREREQASSWSRCTLRTN